MLESSRFSKHYPAASERSLGKYGNSKGWRRNRLRTASGFTLDAIGLDSAARGAKVDEDRPDFIILDDLDGELDSPETTAKKVKTLTRKLLPAGAHDVAILAVQNLVSSEGIFARLAGVSEQPADFLLDRVVSGPHPALRELAHDGTRLLSGKPTWEGQDLARCQEMVNDMGISAFLAECQHEVEDVDGSLFGSVQFLRCEPDDMPNVHLTVCWLDPAVTDTDQSDSQGIQIDGLGVDGKVYRLYSWESRSSPLETMRHALRKSIEFKCSYLGVETDQGGDTWMSVYREAVRLEEVIGAPKFRQAKAGAGHGPKAHRAQQMLADYERGQIVHVIGTHDVLEKALRRFPVRKPFDLTDAAYWAWNDLARMRRDMGGIVRLRYAS